MKSNKGFRSVHKQNFKQTYQQESRDIDKQEVGVDQEEIHFINCSDSISSTSTKTLISATVDFDVEM